MDFPNTPFDLPKKFNTPNLDALNRVTVDLLGGEALEAGFEDETPEPDFQFDWTLPKHQLKGGLQ